MATGMRALIELFGQRERLKQRKRHSTQQSSGSHGRGVKQSRGGTHGTTADYDRNKNNANGDDAVTTEASLEGKRVSEDAEIPNAAPTRDASDRTYLDDEWASLPVDILHAVSKELQLRDLLACRRVNRHWSIAGRHHIGALAIDTQHLTPSFSLSQYLRQLADGGYSNLRQLKLSSQFQNGYQNLNLLTNLTTLDVSGCAAQTHQLSSGLAALTQLSSLTAGWTQLKDTGATAIAGLTSLKTLNLEWCRITEVALVEFRRLTRLTHLRVCGMSWMSTHCLQPLTVHKELVSLDLSSMHLSDQALAPVAALKKLTHLNLAMNPISCAAMNVISGLTQLRKLSLKKTNVGNEGLRLLTSLVRLRRLNLSGTAVEDRGLRSLTHFGLLSSLDLSDNYMVGWNSLEHLMPLTSLTFLHRLYLHNTQANPTTARDLALEFRPKKLWIEY